MSDPGQLRRALQATNEALALREAENAYARPCADALHTYCAARDAAADEQGLQRALDAHQAMFVVHRATTPSPVPPTHVLVPVDGDSQWREGFDKGWRAHELLMEAAPPTHVLVRADELAWLRGVRLAAEVAALAMHPEHVREVLHSLRNQLAAEPAAAA